MKELHGLILFDSNGFWEIGESKNEDVSSYVSQFESYILEKLNHTGHFNNLCRIKMLSFPSVSEESTVFKESAGQPEEQFCQGQEIDGTVVGIEVQKGSKLKTTITDKIQGSDCQPKEEIYKKIFLYLSVIL